MNYQVLARKWRPQRFNEVIGQDPIVHSLSNSVMQDTIASCYLFAGTRGVGKTSLARIFARTLRCEKKSDLGPCLECSPCKSFGESTNFDVIEIDGASYNGVDNIRQIIDNVPFLPTQGRFKIYIIDEVHMLTKEAFNALLKTLEEPPRHVIFIFATTEADKILPTVLSRCQRFDFRSPDFTTLRTHLDSIISDEKIFVEDQNYLDQIAHEAQGSVRDMLSLLEQILTYEGRITSKAMDLLGNSPQKALKDLSEAIYAEDPVRCSAIYRELLSLNIGVEKLFKDLLKLFVKDISEKNDFPKAELFWISESLAKDFTWAIQSIDPVNIGDIILQKICYRSTFFLNKKKSEQKSWKGFLQGLKSKNSPLLEHLPSTLSFDPRTEKWVLPQSSLDIGLLQKEMSSYYQSPVQVEFKKEISEHPTILKALSLFDGQVDKVAHNRPS